jgi:hypothetical protein
MNKILAIFLLALCGQAHATDYYYNKCDAGAAPQCAANVGVNAAAGTVGAPRKDPSEIATDFASAGCAGRTLFLAQGGSWNTLSAMAAMQCTTATKASPITIAEYTPSWLASICTGSGTVSSPTGTGMSTGLSPTLNQWAGCDVKVTSSVAGAKYTQRFTIASNTTGGVLTLATYKDGTSTDSNSWEYTPTAGDVFTITGAAPLLWNNVGTAGSVPNIMSMYHSGQTNDLHGITLIGLHLEGGAFQRPVEAGSTQTVINDSTLGSVGGYVVNDTRLVGRTLRVMCSNNGSTGVIASNTTTSITVSTIGCTVATGNQYGVEGAVFGAYFLAHNADVILDGMQLNGTGVGYYCAGGTAPIPHNVVVKNGSFRRNNIGVLSGCPNTLLENNYFAHNGTGVGDHHIYLQENGPGIPMDQTYVRGNRFSDENIGAAGLCRAVAIVKHGSGSGVFIENNLLTEATLGSGSCWAVQIGLGYALPEGFSNVQFRGNTLVNFNQGVMVDLCDTCLIENNYIYQPDGGGVLMRDQSKVARALNNGVALTLGATTGSVSVSGAASFTADLVGASFFVPGDGAATFTGYTSSSLMQATVTTPFSSTTVSGSSWYYVDTQPRNMTIRNNTVNLTAPTTAGNAVGISIGRNTGDNASLGGHKVYSNIVILGSPGSTSVKCYDTSNLVAGDFSGFDYNHCYTAGATPIDGKPTGMNTNGNSTPFSSSPGVTVGAAPNFPMTITSGSAAYNTGSPTNSSPYAIGGYKRSGTGAPSKGAHEPNASTLLPGTPTKIEIQ